MAPRIAMLDTQELGEGSDVADPRLARVVAIMNGKGGVGKTSLSGNAYSWSTWIHRATWPKSWVT